MPVSWPPLPDGSLTSARVRHRMIDVGDVRLNVVEAGPEAGPPVLFLHGFPETSSGWRHQLGHIAAAGYHCLVPDQRGYGDSDKPAEVEAYRMDHLLADVIGLLDALKLQTVDVVCHDWGGVVGWMLAMEHPERVGRLVVLNAPHPATFRRELRKPGQLLKSWYMAFFQIPWLPERLMTAFGQDMLRTTIVNAFTQPAVLDLDELAAWLAEFPDARAMGPPIHWYRATFRYDLRTAEARIRPIERPTLLLWGMLDHVLSPAIAEGLDEWVPGIQVKRIPDAGHFVQHEQPSKVNAALLDFLGRASAELAEAARSFDADLD